MAESEKDRLCRLGRMLRAIELGLDPNVSWSEISAAYNNHPPELEVATEGASCDEWLHPLSAAVVNGRRITQDLTILTEKDLYASSDGTWRTCPVPGVMYRPWSKTIWIRPS